MKKRVLFASIALSAITLASCGGSKKADSTSAEPVAVELQLTDSIKTEVLVLWENVQASSGDFLSKIEPLPAKAKKIGATFYTPLALADKAQTQEQKAALVGCYTADMVYDRFAYENEKSDAAPVVAKLCTELNIKDFSSFNWDEAAKMSKEDALKYKADEALKIFKEALESNTADKNIIVMAYTLMESSLNSIALYEARTGQAADEVQIVEDMKSSEAFRNHVLELVTMMLPYYPSLEVLAPTVAKMQAIKNATSEEDWMGAILEYFAFVKETRAKLETSLM